MKTLIGKISLIVILMVFSLLTGILTANGEEFKKYIEKKFDVDKDATLSLSNKFGEVHCEVWNNKQVSVKVEITVEASSQERANKVFDRITVEVAGDQRKVTGQTEVGNMSFNNTEFSIDYYVMMPKSINIDLKNSFGEIFVEETDGEARVHLEYGDMEIMALNGDYSDITVKFGEGSVGYMKNGKIRLEYSELDIEGANDLDVYTRFSELNIEKMENLSLDTQYDDIQLGHVGTSDVVARFSEVEIDHLNGNFSFDLQYGGLEADDIFAGFTEGRLDVAFAEITLTFDPEASFQVDAEMKFCSLSYPSNASVTHKEEGYVTNLYKGVIGSDQGTSAKLVIDSKNGDVNIEF
jgi:hypothetical protein